MIERALAVLGVALAIATAAWANGGGVILTPPPDFTEIAPGSVESLLAGVHVKHAVEEDGAIWAATLDRGLAHRARGARDFAWLDRRSGRLPDDALTRVVRFRGETWVGLARGGAVKLSARGFEAYGAKEGLPGEEVVEMAVQGGRLWVLTSAGLAVLAGRGFAPAPVAGEPPRGTVTALATGFDGKLYAGTDQTDVGVFDGTAWKRHAFANRIVGRVIRCVAPGVGHIWFGTFGSLNDYTPETGRLDDETAEKAILFPSRIMVALAGNEQIMLTATSGGGLYRFDRPAAWHLYSDANGLPSTSINSVTLNHPHALVSTAAGLARVDLAKPLPSELKRSGAAPPDSPAPVAPATPQPSAASPFVAPAGLGDTASLPAPTTSLGATGRTLLEIPSLLGQRGFTCLSCHRLLHGNPAFTSPTGPPGTVDLTSAFTAPASDDRMKNPRKIPGLFGLRYRGPYPSGGSHASLRDYLRAHIVRDMEAPEPSPAALDALEVYLLSLEPPPPPGVRDDGQLRIHIAGAARRGEVLFRRGYSGLAGKSCASCHVPEQHFTDNRLHLRRDGRWVRTPTLLGLARAAPYLSDGSRRSLSEVASYYNDVYHLLLKRGDVDDLVAYLATVGEVAGP